MNKTFFALAFAAAGFMMMSCGGSKKEENKENADDAYEIAEPKGPSSEEMIAEGKTLVDGSDCRACHHPTNKLVGPSHTDVAKKYEFTEANVKLLAEKIIKGGNGVWGDIAMSPHPALTEVEAEKMARYVLSLDGEKEH